MKRETYRRYAGLDLGKKSDFSALAVVECGQRYARNGVFESYLHCNHLKRWPLLTPYPEIVEDVAKMFRVERRNNDELKGPMHGHTLVVDGTGVGDAVVDMFRAIRPVVKLVPVVITGGATESRVNGTFRVAKLHLASVLTEVLENGRLKIAEMPLRKWLVEELKTFSVKITKAGNETFESIKDNLHDDGACALALGCWAAERFGGMPSGRGCGSTPPAHQGGPLPNHVANRIALSRLRGGGGPLGGGS